MLIHLDGGPRDGEEVRLGNPQEIIFVPPVTEEGDYGWVDSGSLYPTTALPESLIYRREIMSEDSAVYVYAGADAAEYEGGDGDYE